MLDQITTSREKFIDDWEAKQAAEVYHADEHVVEEEAEKIPNRGYAKNNLVASECEHVDLISVMAGI